jgi:hypothetical protein
VNDDGVAAGADACGLWDTTIGFVFDDHVVHRVRVRSITLG